MRRVIIGLSFIVLTMLVAIAVQQGCGESRITWSSSRVLEIKREWDAVAKTPTRSKDDCDKVQVSLHEILARNLSGRDVRSLPRPAGLPASTKKRTEFDNAVLAYIVTVLVGSGDRDDLVGMLSVRCPSRIYAYETLEYYLAAHADTLKDPIVVLGDAYSKCQVPSVRHDIAAAVRRGFAGHGIRGKGDDEFVKNAMGWYEAEKGHLTVNVWYWSNDSFFPLELYDADPGLYENFSGLGNRKPLFKER